MTNRSGNRREKSKPQTVAYAFLFAFLLVGVLFILVSSTRGPIVPNICPIDGQLAEWSKRQGQRDCEYGHFSTVEKKPHTWVAACP